ncbi:DUF5658 family protein [Ureibacillus thermosphaericus]|uniref:DUF5658 family protein n=1 Tax=Ureibacillus thermosphaericus TaxID=51173 RepID=UPI000BBB8EB4
MKRNKQIFILSLLVAILNIFDGIATHYGLMNHFIKEINPLMRFFFEANPYLFLGIKFSLSVFIFIVSNLVILKCIKSFQRFYLYALTGISILYSGLFFVHLYWLWMSNYSF